MKFQETDLPGVIKIFPRTFPDKRGYFLVTWGDGAYRDLGIEGPFVQDNLSSSAPHVLRGMHLQNPHQQAKLVTVLQGAVFDAVVDVRVGSPTFGRWTAVNLTAAGGEQLYVPRGFAHGFAVTKGPALVSYKVDAPYAPEAELTLKWDDPEVRIDWPHGLWPTSGPVLSEGDRSGIRLSEFEDGVLPRYDAT